MTTATSGGSANPAVSAADLEFEGKTVDKAVEAACLHFGVSREDLEIEIITHGSTGIFGLRGRKARIKAERKVNKSTAAPQTQQADEETETYAVSEPKTTSLVALSEEIQKTHIESTLAPSERATIVKELAHELLAKTGLRANVTAEEKDGALLVQFSGPDLSLIIGKEGQTLDALEYILNRMVFRKVERPTKVSLDAEGYRQKREHMLTQLAQRMAAKARRTGRPVAIQPMGPRDRRIVHMALRDVQDVHTRSVEEGDMRKVMVIPARRTRPKRTSQRE